MRLYKIVAKDGEEKVVEWVGTKADGVTKRKALGETFKRNQITETEVDVPTDKVGLLAWLNEHAK